MWSASNAELIAGYREGELSIRDIGRELVVRASLSGLHSIDALLDEVPDLGPWLIDELRGLARGGPWINAFGGIRSWEVEPDPERREVMRLAQAAAEVAHDAELEAVAVPAAREWLGTRPVEAMLYFLTSARLGFRCWRDYDSGKACDLWGDAEVMRLVGGALEGKAIRARLLREIATQEAHAVQYWPIFLRTDGAHVGCAGLRPYAEGVLELGVHLRPAYWRQGLAREAGRAVIAHGFTLPGVRALFAGHHPDNAASRQLLLGLGFRYTHDELYAPTGLMHPSYRYDAS